MVQIGIPVASNILEIPTWLYLSQLGTTTNRDIICQSKYNISIEITYRNQDLDRLWQLKYNILMEITISKTRYRTFSRMLLSYACYIWTEIERLIQPSVILALSHSALDRFGLDCFGLGRFGPFLFRSDLLSLYGLFLTPLPGVCKLDRGGYGRIA